MTGGTVKQSEIEFLQEVLHLEVCGFAGMSTGRRFRKRTAEDLVADGYLEPKMMVVSDGDGFTIEPERWRKGYMLTDKARAYLEAQSGE